LSPSGLVSAGPVQIHDAVTGRLLSRLREPRHAVFRATFGPDGLHLAVCGYDRSEMRLKFHLLDAGPDRANRLLAIPMAARGRPAFPAALTPPPHPMPLPDRPDDVSVLSLPVGCPCVRLMRVSVCI